MEFHMYKHKMFFYGVTLYTLKLRTKKSFPLYPVPMWKCLKKEKSSDKIGYVCLTCEKHICD